VPRHPLDALVLKAAVGRWMHFARLARKQPHGSAAHAWRDYWRERIIEATYPSEEA
jgi:hypothetical protein